jgi:uncharacterized integral membrane protein
MKLRTWILLIVFGAVAAFAALNWSAFTSSTTLSLGFTEIQAPLGIIMLGLLAFLSALFLAFVVYLQSSVLLEARRHARELQTHRELADQAEASRFTELRAFLEVELKRLADQDTESRSLVLQRLDQLDRDSRSAQEQSENAIAAYMGEFEDRLDKAALRLPVDR